MLNISHTTLPDLPMGSRRLIQLAEELESVGLWPHNEGVDFECGTAAGALGKCPYVFPHHWWIAAPRSISDTYYPALIDDSAGNTLADACSFFLIGMADVAHLFVPYMQRGTLGSVLSRAATKEQVAAGIRAFVFVGNQVNQAAAI